MLDRFTPYFSAKSERIYFGISRIIAFLRRLEGAPEQ